MQIRKQWVEEGGMVRTTVFSNGSTEVGLSWMRLGMVYWNDTIVWGSPSDVHPPQGFDTLFGVYKRLSCFPEEDTSSRLPILFTHHCSLFVSATQSSASYSNPSISAATNNNLKIHADTTQQPKQTKKILFVDAANSRPRFCLDKGLMSGISSHLAKMQKR